MYIDGKWVDAKNGKTFAVYNPASGEIVDHMPDGGSDGPGGPQAQEMVRV